MGKVKDFLEDEELIDSEELVENLDDLDEDELYVRETYSSSDDEEEIDPHDYFGDSYDPDDEY